jgi:predicted transcriptional regulator
MEIIKKDNISIILKDISREDIKNTAIEFSTSQINPLDRAFIVYVLKKLLEDIEKFDKEKQSEALREFFIKNKNSTTPPELKSGFGVIERPVTEKRYSDEQLALELQVKIKQLQEQLKALEINEVKSYTYYIKETNNGK